MDANEYQRAALRTWNGEEDAIGLMYASGKLCAESGEVMQLIAKWVMHSKLYTAADISDELGDVMWYVSIVAKMHDLRLGDVMAGNIDKLSKRHPDGDTSKFYGGE